MQFVEIPWRGDLYQQEIALRDQVLRRPLGLTFSDEDLQAEAEDLHFGLIDSDETLVACVVIVKRSATLAKLRQMAVSPDRQRKGLGTTLIQKVEEALQQRGFEQVELNARDIAMGFYERLGYQQDGDMFIEVSIPHYKMTKVLPCR